MDLRRSLRRNIGLSLTAACLLVVARSTAAKSGPAFRETILYSFAGGGDGIFPEGNVVSDASGALYSTTQYGGTGCKPGCGTAFKLTPFASGYKKSVIYEFRGHGEGGYPETGFIMDKTGALYGTLISGGLRACRTGCGTVFKLVPNGSTYRFQLLYAFKGGADGNGPWAGLVMDRSGALYGTTVNGGGAKKRPCHTSKGFSGCGIVFKLTPTASGYTESVVYAFQGEDDGALPYGTLIVDKQGALYGTTSAGGDAACSCGTVFKLTKAGSSYVETTIHRFAGIDGAEPYAGLTVDKNGTLYGTTQYGGGSACGVQSGCGAVFALAPGASGYVERVLYVFRGGRSDGSYPDATPVLDDRGALYGTTQNGGGGIGCQTGGCGIVYRLTPSSSGYSENVLYAFEGGADGSFPQNGVMLGAAGSLFGTAASGGRADSGIVFELNGSRDGPRV